MSWSMETLNRGEVEDCGFVFGDTERVRLGALPAMPIDQFAEYSTDALIAIISSIETPNDLRDSIRISLAYMCGKISQAYADTEQHETNDPRLELFRRIRQNIIPQMAENFGNPARDYLKNPFSLENGQVNLSNFYVIDVHEFVEFTRYVLEGGLSGWTQGNEIPKPIYENSKRLMKSIRENAG